MELGKIGILEVQYLGVDQCQEWVDALPLSNWLLLTVTCEVEPVLFSAITKACIEHKPSYICCVGESASIMEDWFDEEIVEKALAWEEEHKGPFDYGLAPTTTADTSLDEGFWFATSVAPLSDESIKTLFCLDLTNQSRSRIQELIPLINAGWFPPNE
ncbi:hypothetical protein [Hymenobacter sp. B1770]|uniref:hypothetical protein n=1 Tax=Hymenobacter sp. B1770 TaxID=1718788 RepID=UPI003CE9B4EC